MNGVLGALGGAAVGAGVGALGLGVGAIPGAIAGAIWGGIAGVGGSLLASGVGGGMATSEQRMAEYLDRGWGAGQDKQIADSVNARNRRMNKETEEAA